MCCKYSILSTRRFRQGGEVNLASSLSRAEEGRVAQRINQVIQMNSVLCCAVLCSGMSGVSAEPADGLKSK